MSFDVSAFAKTMKLALADFHSVGNEVVDLDEQWIARLSDFNAKSLSGDAEKLAFWINLYNGLTNYQIVKNQLKETVWELPGFFSNRNFQVGEFPMSLDDIEHGVLRQNGPRKNDKPSQFQDEDPRCELMLERMDPRIHFALNCGALSCPPIAFYSAKNIDQELALAEANFASQEFMVDHETRTIHCSEIFVWYRSDFENQYLDDPALVAFQVEPIPYCWAIGFENNDT